MPLFFSMVTLVPALGFQPASAAIDKVQQQSAIKGIVVDEKENRLSEPNVVAEGTTTGTITDIDGVFRLNVSAGTKLKISFIGFEAKTVVAKNDNACHIGGRCDHSSGSRNCSLWRTKR